MAIQALKSGRTGAELMAGVALRGAAERFVGLGERAGGYLRVRSSASSNENKDPSGHEQQLPERSPESVMMLARRPQVRFALAQEFLRFGEEPLCCCGTPFECLT